MWIDKLIHCAPHERQLRNTYLEQLCRHAEQHVLGPPFNNPPSEGPLLAIPPHYMLHQGVALDEETAASWSDVSETSCETQSATCRIQLEAPKIQPQIEISSATVSTTTVVDCDVPDSRTMYFYPGGNVPPTNCKPQGPTLPTKLRQRRPFKKHTCTDSNDDLPFKDCYESPVHKRAPVRVRMQKKVENKNKKNKKCKTPWEAISHDSSDYDDHDDVFKTPNQKLSKPKFDNDSHNEPSKSSQDAMEELQRKLKCEEEKLLLEKEISELKIENESLAMQLGQQKTRKEQYQKCQDTLKQEVFELRDKLVLVEKVKNALETEHKEATRRMGETVQELSQRVQNACVKNDKLEVALNGIISKLEQGCSVEADLQRARDKWSEKIKNMEKEHNDKVCELKEEHAKIIQGYESTITDMKKELSKKNKDVARLEKQIQDQCGRMRTEVENIKRDMERTAQENEVKSNSKISAYKMKIVKLLKNNKKITDAYEEKISSLNKAKDMELWVQKLNFGSDLTNGKKNEMEKIVTALEERFKKHLSDITEKAAYHSQQKLKYRELMSELEKNNSPEIEKELEEIQ